MKSEDRGTYVCIAANDLDEGERKHVNLFVKYPPIVEAVKSEVGQMQGQDLDAYLECVVSLRNRFPYRGGLGHGVIWGIGLTYLSRMEICF